MQYSQYTKPQLESELENLRTEYKAFQDKKLRLDMSRGKPSPAQLALTQDMLGVISSHECCITEDGIDCRNYGLLDGIPEAKKLFGDLLCVPAANIIIGGNSSLNMMYDEIARCMLFGTCDSPLPWSRLDKVKFLCPVPGYDRHFSICESMGIEMINIPMTPEGPDMDMVEELVASDDSIKGIWCVPKYSNPEGVVYSDETILRFASLKTAAPDFRIFWDDAYIIHSLNGEPAHILNIFDEAAKAGNPNLPVIFTSTSKISFPGSGIAAMASSDANIKNTKKYMSVQTIGYDKLNQMRHVLYFHSADGMREHMKHHADIIRPKFRIVLDNLKTLEEYGIAQWTEPDGGYFISLDVLDGCASRVYNLMKDAGVTMTGAGATFPYGKDPRDRNLRIAPSFPSNEELETASKILVLCVRIAGAERLLSI